MKKIIYIEDGADLDDALTRRGIGRVVCGLVCT